MGAVVLAAGVGLYMLRARHTGEWPFASGSMESTAD
jgi:hypothetical protein